MKKIYIIILPIVILGTYACKEECSYPVGSKCFQKESDAGVSSDPNLINNYESWFYDVDENTCKKKAYTGTDEVGFETEADCLTCDCN